MCEGQVNLPENMAPLVFFQVPLKRPACQRDLGLLSEKAEMTEGNLKSHWLGMTTVCVKKAVFTSETATSAEAYT